MAQGGRVRPTDGSFQIWVHHRIPGEDSVARHASFVIAGSCRLEVPQTKGYADTPDATNASDLLPCGRTTPRSTSRDDALSTAHRSSGGARRRPRSLSKIIVRARAERSAVSHGEPIRCIRCIRSIRIALRLWGRRGDATVSLARMPSTKTPLIPKFRDEPKFGIFQFWQGAASARYQHRQLSQILVNTLRAR